MTWYLADLCNKYLYLQLNANSILIRCNCNSVLRSESRKFICIITSPIHERLVQNSGVFMYEMSVPLFCVSYSWIFQLHVIANEKDNCNQLTWQVIDSTKKDYYQLKLWSDYECCWHSCLFSIEIHSNHIFQSVDWRCIFELKIKSKLTIHNYYLCLQLIIWLFLN